MFKILVQFFRKKDEIIGIWTKEDDGSGLINFFGQSFYFFENNKGKSYYWESKTETIYDFEWQRENKNQIKLHDKYHKTQYHVYR